MVEEKGIISSDQYNFDETGFRIGMGKDQWIITCDPSRQAYLASSQNQELITSIKCISGNGSSLPLILIVATAQHPKPWFTGDLEDDVLIGVSDSGYSCDALSLK